MQIVDLPDPKGLDPSLNFSGLMDLGPSLGLIKK